MRDYLSESNFFRAMALGALCTAAALPRILLSGLNLSFYVPAAFFCMTLVAGAVTAWGRRAGMAGIWTGRRRTWTGVGIAALAALVLAPLALRVDPVIRSAYADAGGMRALGLQYPSSSSGIVALILWSASFEMLFFVAAAGAFFARIFHHRWIAILGPVIVRLAVAHYQVTTGGVTDAAPLIYTGLGITMAVACALFAYAGLVAPALFIALLEARLLFL